jgi:hypothetical protein
MASADNADQRSEAEIQALIAYLEVEQPIETPNNIGYSFYPRDLRQAARYFRRALVDWSAASPVVVGRWSLGRARG